MLHLRCLVVYFFAVKLCNSFLNLTVDLDKFMNEGRDKTAIIIFHDCDSHFDISVYIYIFVSASSKNVF